MRPLILLLFYSFITQSQTVISERMVSFAHSLVGQALGVTNTFSGNGRIGGIVGQIPLNYLPLTAGSTKTITGDIYLQNSRSVTNTAGNAFISFAPNILTNAATSSTWYVRNRLSGTSGVNELIVTNLSTSALTTMTVTADGVSLSSNVPTYKGFVYATTPTILGTNTLVWKSHLDALISSVAGVSGTVTLSSGLATITSSMVTAQSNIQLTVGPTGIYAGRIRVTSITPGVSFTIGTNNASDDCSVFWWFK